MRELTKAHNSSPMRHQLLSTASAFALLVWGSSAGASEGGSDDTSQPTVWIELGAQMEHINGQGETFAPGFLSANAGSPVLGAITPIEAQRSPPFSFAGEGSISIQPKGSQWRLSAAVNYGRSSNFKHVHHQTDRVNEEYAGYFTTAENFSDTKARRKESHMILDFLAGREVGLGMFGRDISSTLNVGVRFAQFSSKETVGIRARPDLGAKYFTPPPPYTQRFALIHFHTYYATGQASRSFQGIGPSLSWTGSAAVIGSVHAGEVALDWGANAALLFGRQKTRVQHLESGHYKSPGLINFQYQLVYQKTGGHSGDHSVAIPNAGGFAGVSFRVENFRASVGYRADFFFGAIDGGIDTRKSETLGFYGPFATISVGLGG